VPWVLIICSILLNITMRVFHKPTVTGTVIHNASNHPTEHKKQPSDTCWKHNARQALCLVMEKEKRKTQQERPGTK
jgi:hypothetical protein